MVLARPEIRREPKPCGVMPPPRYPVVIRLDSQPPCPHWWVVRIEHDVIITVCQICGEVR